MKIAGSGAVANGGLVPDLPFESTAQTDRERFSARCRTAEQLEQAENQQMQSVVGLTMADFSGQTGLTPMDAYDVGRTVTLVTPGSYGAPTVANN